MTHFTIKKIYHKNAGIARHLALRKHFGLVYKPHDNSRYDKSSDLILGDMRISVKTSAFTLMSGSLCKGNTFDEIWEFYASRTDSNYFAYITTDFKVYMMNREEFKAFVYQFCRLDKESAKNGGAIKIRCKKENKKMLEWLITHTPV